MENVQVLEIPLSRIRILNQIQDIYENSFRSSVRIPWDCVFYKLEIARIKRKLRKSNIERYHLIGAFKDNNLVGFAISKFFWEFTYASYLAVDANHRNQAIGTQLAQKVIEIAKADALELQIPNSVVLFEVEKPEDASNALAKHQLRKKWDFYRKFTACFLDIDYLQPNFHWQGIPMYLVMASLTKQNYIDSSRLIRFVKIIYQLQYNLHPRKPGSQFQYFVTLLVDSVNLREKIFGSNIISS